MSHIPRPSSCLWGPHTLAFGWLLDGAVLIPALRSRPECSLGLEHSATDLCVASSSSPRGSLLRCSSPATRGYTVPLPNLNSHHYLKLQVCLLGYPQAPALEHTPQENRSLSRSMFYSQCLIQRLVHSRDTINISFLSSNVQNSPF